jgi:hypothetical protein
MKRVLVVHYSQTGQLSDLLRSIIAPLQASPDIEVTTAAIRPVTPYPFAWPFWRFFDTFPETVYEDVPPVQPLDIAEDAQFDLIIFGYTIWFLSPSQPTTAFLQSAQAARLLRDKPVVTVIACRSMWLMGHEVMKGHLRRLGARLIDNIVLTDNMHSALSFIATPLWMLTGRRGPFLGGLVPVAGVAREEIADAARFGEAIARQLPRRDSADSSPMLQGLGAVEVNERLIASETIARRSFRIWGGLLRALGRPGTPLRRLVLVFYVVFLVTLILTVVPISAVIKRLLAPLSRQRVARQRAYFAAPSGEARG